MSEGCVLLSRRLMEVIRQCLFTDPHFLYMWEDRYYATWKDHSKWLRWYLCMWSISSFIRGIERQNIKSFAYPMKSRLAQGLFQNLIWKSSYLYGFILTNL